MLHCLNTGIQKTNHGGAIFALSAVKAMPGDEDIGKLHAHALSEAGKHADAVDVHVIDETPLLGPRFFKHMTHAFGLERMLTNRPDLRTAPVNKKTGLPLAQYQSQHLRPHRLLQHVRETRARPTRTSGCSCTNAPSRIWRRRAWRP